MARYKNLGPELSGNAYVSAVYHDEPVNKNTLMKISIRSTKNCDHGKTICTKWKCVEGWAIDHHLLFNRTNGGRKIAAAVGWDADKILRPDPARPMAPPTVTT